MIPEITCSPKSNTSLSIRIWRFTCARARNMSRKYDTNTEAREVVDDLSASIAGTTVLVTGVSPGGLGAFFAEQIARAQPKLLILAGRSVAKLQATAEVIQKTGTSTKLLELDLSRLAHVRGSAEKVNTWQDVSVIDVLVNNAGIMAVDYEKTEDGFEKQFATNHLGPFLFTNLIIPKILASGKPRIVNVSSDGHRLSPVRFADYGFHVRLVNAGMRAMELTKSQDGENYDRWLAYGQSKTANILHAVSLAHKLGPKGLTAISLHPGVIRTNLSTHIDWEKDFKELRTLHHMRAKSPITSFI